jgi:hypothetical protein
MKLGEKVGMEWSGWRREGCNVSWGKYSERRIDSEYEGFEKLLNGIFCKRVYMRMS